MKKRSTLLFSLLVSVLSVNLAQAESPSWVSGTVAITKVGTAGSVEAKVNDGSTASGKGSTTQVAAGGAVALTANSKSKFKIVGAYAEINGKVKAEATSTAKAKSGGTTQACAAASCAMSAN